MAKIPKYGTFSPYYHLKKKFWEILFHKFHVFWPFMTIYRLFKGQKLKKRDILNDQILKILKLSYKQKSTFFSQMTLNWVETINFLYKIFCRAKICQNWPTNGEIWIFVTKKQIFGHFLGFFLLKSSLLDYGTKPFVWTILYRPSSQRGRFAFFAGPKIHHVNGVRTR